MNKQDNNIIWTGTFFDHGGYAYMDRTYVRNLIDRGWKVNIEAIKSPLEINDDEKEYFFNLCHRPILFKNGVVGSDIVVDPEVKALNPAARMPPPKNSVKVIAHLPLTNVPRPQGGKRVIYTMMECLKVNLDFIHNRCNKFYEECWTPTEYNARVFKEMGLSIPVKVLPIGIDPMFKKENAIEDYALNYKVFGPEGSPEQPEGFKFLSVFRWSFRKGFDLLLKSYLREFKKKDNVSLIIMSRHAAMSHDPLFKEAIENDIREFMNQYGTPDSPPIYWCNDIIPMDLMPSMYNIGDAFISCSRGEGFCIPALEASKMDLPIIAPNHTGFTDYLTDENSYNFDVDEWVVCDTVDEWKRGWITKDFTGQEFPRFGEKTVEQVMSLMREVKENPDKSKLKNENLKQVIEEKYSWDKCTDKLEKYLSEL